MSNGTDLNPIIHVSGSRRWQNWHGSVDQPVEQLIDIWNGNSSESTVRGYNATSRAIQGLIRDAVAQRRQIRALGGGWSFSPVAATDGVLLNTRPLNYRFGLSSRDVVAGYTGDPSNLILAQCGMSVAQLNEHLKSRGKSLQTSGASNGQTIAGAISTGTHGAAIDVGAVHDSVVGLHIIVAPDRQVWLERRTSPVIADDLPQLLGAELIRDDDLFNAALVSLGSFGIIHGVLVEVEDLFHLQAYRKRVPLEEALWAAVDGLDFSGGVVPGTPEHRPYHFQVLINPHERETASVTVMYKHPAPPSDCKPLGPSGKITQGDNALEVMGTITDLVSVVTPFVITELMKRFFPDYDGVCGTLGQIFTDSTTRGKGASTAMGIPLGRVREALDIAFRLNEGNPIAGLFALRYPKASRATLAFTLHRDQTCVLEIDAPRSERTSEFYQQLWRGLDDSGIPYAFHWGKLNDLDSDRVLRMYGEQRIESWRAARHALLPSADLQDVFANQFLHDVGLAT